MDPRAILLDAFASPLGLRLEVDSEKDRERLRQKLYKARQSDEDLKVLSFVVSPDNPLELWIVRTKESSNATD